jgi:hypothetical protein
MARGPQRKVDYAGTLDTHRNIYTPEEERKLCNYGSHYYFVDKITNCDPWLIVIVKWKCLFCKKVVEKEVTPNDD